MVQYNTKCVKSCFLYHPSLGPKASHHLGRIPQSTCVVQERWLEAEADKARPLPGTSSAHHTADPTVALPSLHDLSGMAFSRHSDAVFFLCLMYCNVSLPMSRMEAKVNIGSSRLGLDVSPEAG